MRAIQNDETRAWWTAMLPLWIGRPLQSCSLTFCSWSLRDRNASDSFEANFPQVYLLVSWCHLSSLCNQCSAGAVRHVLFAGVEQCQACHWMVFLKTNEQGMQGVGEVCYNYQHLGSQCLCYDQLKGLFPMWETNAALEVSRGVSLRRWIGRNQQECGPCLLLDCTSTCAAIQHDLLNPVITLA